MLQPSGALWFSGAGACLAGLFAFYSLRHHRQLIVAYAGVEALAAANRRELKSAQLQLLHSEKMGDEEGRGCVHGLGPGLREEWFD